MTSDRAGAGVALALAVALVGGPGPAPAPAQQPSEPFRPPRPNQEVGPDPAGTPGLRSPGRNRVPARDGDDAPSARLGLSASREFSPPFLESPEEFAEEFEAATGPRDGDGPADRRVRRLAARLASRILAAEEELELARIRLEARRAERTMARLALEQAQADFSLVERLHRRVAGSTSPEEFRRLQARVPAREAEVALREAEAREVEARIRQLDRRLAGYAAVRRRFVDRSGDEAPPPPPAPIAPTAEPGDPPAQPPPVDSR